MIASYKTLPGIGLLLLTACGPTFVNAQGETAGVFNEDARQCYLRVTSAGERLAMGLVPLYGVARLAGDNPRESPEYRACMAEKGYHVEGEPEAPRPPARP